MEELNALMALANMNPSTAHELMMPDVIAAQSLSSSVGLISVGAFMVYLGVFLLIVNLIAVLISSRKSQQYRKLITDMYVAGSVRKLAKEDGICLEEEYKNFIKFDKKRKREECMNDLDRAIEQNLKDRQTERNDIAIEKLSGEDAVSDDYVKLKK